jgi:Uma2 family endonuclease
MPRASKQERSLGLPPRQDRPSAARNGNGQPRARRQPPEPEESPATDPFYYGWRYVERKDQNGRVVVDQVPLTAKDVLHPKEDDQIPEHSAHAQDRTYLAEVCTAQTADEPTTVVLSDCLVAWGVKGVRPTAPDVTVIPGVRERKQWGTFYVARERARPQLVVEITSPKTRKDDLGIKRRYYYRAGVLFYVIVDQLRGRGPRQLRLLGYRRGQRGYEKLPLNDQGRLWLETVRVWLGVEDGQAVCYDANGKRIGTYTEQATARQKAEKRIKQLEADLRRLKGEA